MSASRSLTAIFIASITAFACISAAAANPIETASGKPVEAVAIDAFLTERMKTLNIPGLSIAIINRGEIVYHRELGVSDLTTGQRVDAGSIFEAASLSKPVFAFFTMKLVE